MKNTAENNERYKLPCNEGRGYLQAFTTKGSTHFCEREINQIYNSYGFPFFDQRICADISPAYKRMQLGGKGTNYSYQVFYWQKGKVWRAYLQKNRTWRGIEVEEFAYIHFQKRKMSEPCFDINKIDRYYICSDGFKEKNEIGYPSLETIKRLNPYNFGIRDSFDYFKVINKKIKNKVGL